MVLFLVCFEEKWFFFVNMFLKFLVGEWLIIKKKKRY